MCAPKWMSRPSNWNKAQKIPSQRRAACRAIVSNTGVASARDGLISRLICTFSLEADDAQCGDKVETATAHLIAEGRIICTPLHPESSPKESTTENVTEDMSETR